MEGARILAVHYKPLIAKQSCAKKVMNSSLHRNWFLHKRTFEKPLIPHYKQVLELRKKTKQTLEFQEKEKQKAFNKIYKQKKNEEREIAKKQKEAIKVISTEWLSISGEKDFTAGDIIKDKDGTISKFMNKFGTLNTNVNLLPLESHIFKNSSQRLLHYEEFYSWDQELHLTSKLHEYSRDPKFSSYAMDDLFQIAYAKDLKIRLEKQMREKLEEFGLELKTSTEAKIEKQKFRLLDKKDRLLPNLHADFEFSKSFYIQPRGHGLTKEANQLLTRKLKLQIDVDSLNLPKEVKKRLIEIAGLRYNNGKLKIVAEQQRTVEQNYAYALKLVKDLLHESFLAYTHYVPLSDFDKDPSELVETEDPGLVTVNEPEYFVVDKDVVPFVEGISEHLSPEFLMRYDQQLHPKMRKSMGLPPLSRFHQELKNNIAEKENRTDRKYFTVFRFHPYN